MFLQMELISQKTAVFTAVHLPVPQYATSSLVPLPSNPRLHEKGPEASPNHDCPVAPYRDGQGSIPGQATWDLWWTAALGQVLSEHFGFP
jgi:hypothetical protein